MSNLLGVLGLKPLGRGAPPMRAPGAMPPPPVGNGGTVAPTGTGTVPPLPGANAGPVPPPAPSVATQLAAVDAAVSAAKTDIAALKTDKLKATLDKEVENVVAARDKVAALAQSAAASVIGRVLQSAEALKKRCAELKAGEPAALNQQTTWAVGSATTLTTLINGLPVEAKAVLQPMLDKVKARLPNLRWQIEKGDFKASEAMATAIFFECAGITRAANTYATDFPAYKVERDKADKAIKLLKSHAQVEQIRAEIETLEGKLAETDSVAGKAELKGWEKATKGIAPILDLAARTKKMADELAKVATKIPALTKQFKDEGADAAAAANMARYATKMLVEEKCSEADAVKMAKDAAGFVKAGLKETDALMSSRVKSSLVKGGTPEPLAQEIGKNLRASGTSTADDAKAVAGEMKRFPKKVLEDLNKNGITTECCRGPVTESMPELSGVLPRGWPAGSTWDKVPGVYMGGNKKVVVGTMEKDGKRHVPGEGEGPIPHGSPNLIGHEGGHAFDAADGELKSKNAKFLEARTDDVNAGTPTGMYGPRDNYFLSTAEGGTNDAGATSETFAESFAMHVSGSSKWPKLEAFWTHNPWGA